MTGLTRDAKHVYRWDGGDPIPSVTTVLQVLSKPALVPWAQGIVAEAAIAHRGDIEGWVAVGGVEGAIGLLKQAATTKRDKAAATGSDVHALAEAIIRGQTVVVPEELTGFVNAYRTWVDAFQPEFLAAEEMVANLEHGYAGTLDAIVKISGETWLLDWKTSRGIYSDTALQLAAYGHAEFIGRPGDPTRYAIPLIEQYGVVHIRPEGAELIPYDVTPAEFDAFLDALRLWRWKDTRSKEVMGQPIGPALVEFQRRRTA